MSGEPAPIGEEETIRLVRELLGFELPAECAGGVALNLTALAEHRERLLAPLDE